MNDEDKYADIDFEEVGDYYSEFKNQKYLTEVLLVGKSKCGNYFKCIETCEYYSTVILTKQELLDELDSMKEWINDF